MQFVKVDDGNKGKPHATQYHRCACISIDNEYVTAVVPFLFAYYLGIRTRKQTHTNTNRLDRGYDFVLFFS